MVIMNFPYKCKRIRYLNLDMTALYAQHTH